MKKVLLAVAALILVALAVSILVLGFEETNSWVNPWANVENALWQASSWMNPVVTREEFEALQWIRENTAERTVFVTGIFGGELIMGHTLREGTEGGDWAIVPEVVQRMHDIQYGFYGAPTAEKAHETAKKYGAEFAWVPNRQVFGGYEWKDPDPKIFEDETFFEKAISEAKPQKIPIELINKKLEEDIKKKKKRFSIRYGDMSNMWAVKYKKCIKCGTTEIKHTGKGLCQKCNNKKNYWEGVFSIRTLIVSSLGFLGGVYI